MSLANHEIIKAVSGGVAASVMGHYLSYGTEIYTEYLKYILMVGRWLLVFFLLLD